VTQPLVTIILPIRNEGKHIATCLEAILQQDYPLEQVEILVIDGHSTDNTQAIVRQIAQQAHIIRLLDNPQQIVPTAMNIGIKQAQGEVIIRVDGHTIIAPDYVRTCVEALMSSGADCVGGPMVACGQTPFGEAVALATSHPFGVGGSKFHYATEIMETESVYLGAYRRDVFERVGYFDEEMVRNQDDEFNYRLRARGGKIVLYPTIRSIYYNRSTARSLWRQYFQYGLWKVRVAQKLPGQMRPRHFIPGGLVVSLIGGGILAPVVRAIRLAWLTTLILYSLFNLAVSLKIASQTQRRHFKFLILVFPILHLAYGSGFIWGLIRFANYWRSNDG
jgi:glycosyltransferase involved in cell wall biosynthesis